MNNPQDEAEFEKLNRRYQELAQTEIIPAIRDEYVGPMPQADVWGTQVGGDHYRKYAIQPTEYIVKNRLNFVEGNIIKYVTRYKDKNGLEDLYKAKHYLDILIRSIEEEVNGR